jgi:Myb-like DNA-binding domain
MEISFLLAPKDEEENPSEPAAKKKSKWSPDEDAKIIKLRGKGMKWEDISKQLPGGSAQICRLHYQNYVEQVEWDEERKNKLARLYDRYVEKRYTKVDHI